MKLFVHTPKAVKAGEPVDRLFVVSSVKKDRKGVTWYTAWKCTILPNGQVRHPASTKLLSPSEVLRFKPVETQHCTPTAVFKKDSFYQEWNQKLVKLEVYERIQRFPGIMPAVMPSTQEDFDAMSPATANLVFNSKKGMTKAEVMKLPAGTWVVAKWLDAPDQVLLLINKASRYDSRPQVVDLKTGSDPRPEFNQIIGTRGKVEVPPLRDPIPAKWVGPVSK